MLNTRDWKKRDVKSTQCITKNKTKQNKSVVTMLSANERRESTDIKSSGAEVKTVARGMVVMLKSSDAVGVID